MSSVWNKTNISERGSPCPSVLPLSRHHMRVSMCNMQDKVLNYWFAFVTSLKNTRCSTTGSAKLQEVGPKFWKHVAQRHVNPHKSEDKSKFVQWNYFLYWSMVRYGKNALYEKSVFWRSLVGRIRNICFAMISWQTCWNKNPRLRLQY